MAEQAGNPPVAAMEENYLSYFRQFAAQPGMTMVETPDVAWFVAPHAPGQHVLRTRFSSGDARRQIAVTLARMARLAARGRWLVFATSMPPELPDLLQEAGLVAARGEPWMWTDLGQLPPTPATPDSFHLQRVYDARGLEDWMAVSALGYGMSLNTARIWYDAYCAQGFALDARSVHFVGYLGGAPATAATLLLSDDMAGIFDVATPPRLRRQGLASAVTHAAMSLARARGYRHACLQASAMGVSLYHRLGFATAFVEQQYIWERS